MQDPWKYLAFPVAAVTGYLVSLGATGMVMEQFQISEFLSELIVIGGTALVAGFLVDEVIPAYVHEVRGGGGNLGGGVDLGGGDDFDFD